MIVLGTSSLGNLHSHQLEHSAPSSAAADIGRRPAADRPHFDYKFRVGYPDFAAAPLMTN